MSWILTNSGREHRFQAFGGPENMDHRVEEIAHALAQINRFTGHCRRPYSVAEHSLLVCDLARHEGASPVQQLAALMHDAHEAYVGDMASPLKWMLGHSWEQLERQEAYKLHQAFGIQTVMHSARHNIRRWDRIALATERRDLTLFEAPSHQPWPILDDPSGPVLPSEGHHLSREALENLPWTYWRRAFVSTYLVLRDSIRETSRVEAA